MVFHTVSWQARAQCTFQSLGPDDASPVSFARADYPSLAIDATGLLYVAYADIDNQFKVKVRKYDGSSWINLGLPNFSGYMAENVRIAVDSDNTPYVAYRAEDYSQKISVMKFNGTDWEPVGLPGFSAGKAEYINLLIDENNIPYVAYKDAGNSKKVTVMKFTGGAWVTLGTAGFSTFEVKAVSLSIGADGSLYVAFTDTQFNLETRVMKYNGSGWSMVGTSVSFNSDYNSLAINNEGIPYLAVTIGSNGGRMMRYSEGQWRQVGPDFASTGLSDISLALNSEGIPYVSYQNTGIQGKPTVKKLEGTDWVTLGNTELSHRMSLSPSIALNSFGVPYILYSDQTNGGRARVTKFEGAEWTQVGTQGISLSAASAASLAIDSKGSPYLAFNDNLNGGKATLMKHNGASWSPLGELGFSAGHVNYLSLSIAKATDIPFVAHSDGSQGNKVSVMQYLSSGWANVGSPGFSAGISNYVSLAINAGGVPFVAFQDFGNGGRTTVMRFNGNNWVNVGTAGFSAGTSTHVKLAIDADGVLYVGFKDNGNSGKATVMKFNGSSWVNVGVAGFSAGSTENHSLSIDTAGVPYIAFQDFSAGNRVSVMKFNGANWVNVGNPGFSTGVTTNEISLITDAAGTPYIAFKDAGTNNKARVMKYTNDSWTELDAFGYSPSSLRHLSLAVDAAGTPFLAYSSGEVWAKKQYQSLASSTTQVSAILAPPFSGLFKNDCATIATITPNADNPLNGNTTVKVWVDNVQPAAYVKRHYEIEVPQAIAATATARVTLYFSQSDFDLFNFIAPIDLPTAPDDEPGIANLLIEKIAGISRDGSGRPGSYEGVSETFHPKNDDIVWNTIAGRWEVSFDVTGFSGFFVKTQATSLPVQWLQIHARLNNQQQPILNWEVMEYNVAAYHVESSEDASNFRLIDRIPGKGDGANSYQYEGTVKVNQPTWYRIRQEDIDGKITYSKILKLVPDRSEEGINLYPNPVKDNLYIAGTGRTGSAQLIDLQGRILSKIVFNGSPKWLNMTGCAPGIYLLKTQDGQTYKILKK